MSSETRMDFMTPTSLPTYTQIILGQNTVQKQTSPIRGVPRLQTKIVAKLAAREVSQRGGGARRGGEAPERMSPQGEIPAERAKRRSFPRRASGTSGSCGGGRSWGRSSASRG